MLVADLDRLLARDFLDIMEDLTEAFTSNELSEASEPF